MCQGESPATPGRCKHPLPRPYGIEEQSYNWLVAPGPELELVEEDCNWLVDTVVQCCVTQEVTGLC